ncbi:UNVERIFIED_CONTAM: hypothetical protein Slati_2405200 [Sesamum latifolium]|uniref:RNase H type-1 domain-containing protein n=1 Tax=Sesamum latifolium TaxID=2727402 RepID=A0AAW2WC45_9LAMI
MYFDGAFHKEGAGAVVFATSEGEVLPYSFILTQNCSNNVAEYQALIFGLEMAVNIKQRHLKMYVDSQLVVNQLLGLYEIKKSELLPYHNYEKRLIGWLGDVELEHISRRDNKQVDALAKLASTLSMTDKKTRIQYVRVGSYHQSSVTMRTTRSKKKKITSWSDDEKVQAMEEAHSEVCGAHQSGPKLHFRIKRMGYYWPTMVKDCMDYARRCQACQFHANLIHQPPELLHPIVSSWHFDAWNLDVVVPMTKSSGEAVLPLERQIPSLRIAIQEGFTEEENARIQLEELEAIDEKRLKAQQRLGCYQARLSKAFNKKVRLHSFQVGNLVLAVRRPIITTHRTENKFLKKWDGLYVVKEVYTNGAYKLIAKDGLRIGPINGKFLKRYYT